MKEIFAKLDAEVYFAKRLHDHGVTILSGVTDHGQRKDRIRQAILTCQLDCAIIGRNADKKPETYQQAFERLYGEPLKTNSKHTGD